MVETICATCSLVMVSEGDCEVVASAWRNKTLQYALWVINIQAVTRYEVNETQAGTPLPAQE